MMSGRQNSRSTAYMQINRFPVRIRSQLRSHHGTGMAQRMRPNRFENRTVIGIRTATLMVQNDFLQRFEYERSDPDANVGGTNMHQTETGKHFEAMDVELMCE